MEGWIEGEKMGRKRGEGKKRIGCEERGIGGEEEKEGTEREEGGEGKEWIGCEKERVGGEMGEEQREETEREEDGRERERR